MKFNRIAEVKPSFKRFDLILDSKIYANLTSIIRMLSILIDGSEQLKEINFKLKAIYSNEEYDRIDSIAENEFRAIRQKYPTRSLNLNMICFGRVDNFDESDIEEYDADDLSGANDESMHWKKETDSTDIVSGLTPTDTPIQSLKLLLLLSVALNIILSLILLAL